MIFFFSVLCLIQARPSGNVQRHLNRVACLSFLVVGKHQFDEQGNEFL